MTGDLSPSSLQSIARGKAVLFLGAGAARGATDDRGNTPPTGERLRDLLSDEFLGGKRKDRPLEQVADYAIEMSDLLRVQDFIRSIFEPIQPAPFHHAVASFRWHAIFTTNYDLVLERAYAAATAPLQRLCPIVSDHDRFSDVISDPLCVPYIKLHGCITRGTDPNLPLILAPQAYSQHKKNRTRLFRFLDECGREHPILFVGYSLADWNIYNVLFDLSEAGISRPRFALVRPDLDDMDRSVWGARRFDVVAATYAELLEHLDTSVPKHTRILSALVSDDTLSLKRHFRTRAEPSLELRRYLEEELDHVSEENPSEDVPPARFYRAEGISWSCFSADLDVRRRVTDDLLLHGVLAEGREDPRCILLKGHAGSGKLITLMRCAWESATEHNRIAFCLREGGLVRSKVIAEIYAHIQQPFAFFIDDALAHREQVLELLEVSEKNNVPITLFLGVRTNEWNVHGADLAPWITQEYELRDLSEAEIRQLIRKLEEHNCLGHLAFLREQERVDAFRLTADRQLLVALHEATSGQPFTDIVVDEYKRLTPQEARTLYLDICTLHQLGVVVRVGLIARISGITFGDFRERLLKPLEHVVKVRDDRKTRDYVYQTRHPVIARLVFERILPTAAERVDQIIRLLRCLNVSYASDEAAFSQLIRGRQLADTFADRSYADRIFDAAQESGADAAHILHQRANFEIYHPGGSVRRAQRFIAEAEAQAVHGKNAIRHTRAMVLRKAAFASSNALERRRYRNEAAEILHELCTTGRDSYAYVGSVELLLDEIDELMCAQHDNEGPDKLRERMLIDLVTGAETALANGLSRFPDDQYLLALESRLGAVLEDTPRAVAALESAYAVNPGAEPIAIRLARYYANNGDPNKARTLLSTCVERNSLARKAHYELARLFLLPAV